jgi:alkanesulfonate monooxygenase SsuD/methylene tetrahydromethanopterin reductase-like flavin-dependent oxidoreductase (luciferase family)
MGDVETIAARIREHHEAGADHVAIQPVPSEFTLAIATLTQLASAVDEK